MRAVIQRVTTGAVTVNEEKIGEIGNGLVVLLGVGEDDSPEDIKYIVEKTINLRIFTDQEGKFNLSALDTNAEVLVVSQFTLFGDCRKGRRPSFSKAASPEVAQALYNQVIEEFQKYGLKVATGKFQAEMLVEINNHGPVTMILDSKRTF